MRIGSAAGDGRDLRHRAAGEHARLGERGQEARDRVLELEAPFLPQHHRRHRGDRLGHRVDPPQRVGLDGQVGLDVAAPAGGLVGGLAVARDRDEVARQAAVVDVAVEVRADALEPRGVEAAQGASSRISQSAKVDDPLDRVALGVGRAAAARPRRRSPTARGRTARGRATRGRGRGRADRAASCSTTAARPLRDAVVEDRRRALRRHQHEPPGGRVGAHRLEVAAQAGEQRSRAGRRGEVGGRTARAGRARARSRARPAPRAGRARSWKWP